MAPLSPVPPSEYDSPAVRAQRRLDRARRRARRRAAWWYSPMIIGCLLAGLWGLLKTDQYLADQLFWPSAGAQFVPVGPDPDPDRADETGGPIVVVAGGLNRKSGTGPALALRPALTAGSDRDGQGPTRVFSLVYGSGINDRDIQDKFDALISRTQPDRVDFFGSSMGGDVVLALARHLRQSQHDWRSSRAAEPTPDARPIPAQVRSGSTGPIPVTTFAGRAAGPDAATRTDTDTDGSTSGQPPAPPQLGTIYLDCTPLSVADVRDSGRTQADALTGLSEALQTDGGVGLRLTAEVLAQQRQWSAGRFPFVDVRWAELTDKVVQVWRDKIDGPGVSTQLIKDQYGVIRRTDIDAIAADLGAGTRIVYLRPEKATDDRVVRVSAAEQTLRRLADEHGLMVQIALIPGGHHASAESNTSAYLDVLESLRTVRGS